jgi:RNA polymerase sigma-70 factor (ECF subfamily)
VDLARILRDRRHRFLLARARAGQERSFRILYRSLYGPVMSYVARRIRSSADAEDVVSKVFHRFLTNLDRYDPEKGSVWTWVMTMTRNAVIDHRRAQRPVESIDDLSAVLWSDDEGPLESLVRSEEERLLHGVLRDEPAELREIFALHFGEGMRYGEIAAVLGITEAAVKQRFSRTMRRIRRERSGQTRGGEHEHLGLAAPRRAEDPARS